MNPYKSLLNLNRQINVDKKNSLSRTRFSSKKCNTRKSYGNNTSKSASRVKSSNKSIKKITVRKTSGKTKSKNN